MRTINLEELLEFYDYRVEGSIGHASAINAVLGEDLAVALFLNYSTTNALDPKVLSTKCNHGTKKGKRLDRWISTTDGQNTFHYQTEIKNWSAHAIGGLEAPRVDLNDEKMIAYRKNRWERQFDDQRKQLRQEPAKKVLERMLPIDKNAEVRPLIIFWDSMHPLGEAQEFFDVEIKDAAFKHLWVFSMCTHVRKLIDEDVKTLSIDLPDALTRIDWLEKLYSH